MSESGCGLGVYLETATLVLPEHLPVVEHLVDVDVVVMGAHGQQLAICNTATHRHTCTAHGYSCNQFCNVHSCKYTISVYQICVVHIRPGIHLERFPQYLAS